MVTVFRGGHLLRAGKMEREDLWVRDGKIVPPEREADKIVKVDDKILAPGYIDLQINGGFGVDFVTTPEKINQVAKWLPHFGVTSFLPTVVSSPSEKYPLILKQLQAAITLPKKHSAHILGIHLEGPFLNPRWAGAHDKMCLQSCDQTLNAVYGDLSGVKMVTLAPELDGALSLIKILRSKGIQVSAGHSCANEWQLLQAIDEGLGCVTHLFNGMPPFHHRDPSLAGAVLTHPSLPFTLIADAKHVHPHTMKIAWSCRPNGVMLISDAIEITQLGSQKIEVKEGLPVLSGTHVLAGSASHLDECVRNFWNSTGCPLVEALESASLKPAKFLGLAPFKGTLEIGADADLIVLDQALHIKNTFIKGEEYTRIK